MMKVGAIGAHVPRAYVSARVRTDEGTAVVDARTDQIPYGGHGIVRRGVGAVIVEGLEPQYGMTDRDQKVGVGEVRAVIRQSPLGPRFLGALDAVLDAPSVGGEGALGRRRPVFPPPLLVQMFVEELDYSRGLIVGHLARLGGVHVNLVGLMSEIILEEGRSRLGVPDDGEIEHPRDVGPVPDLPPLGVRVRVDEILERGEGLAVWREIVVIVDAVGAPLGVGRRRARARAR
mmetsp:Transcript_13583/g.39601  ORF Transcript_13583/g.39601 Transcript_13583/m.39601 type:complete len:232 (+) Transcript_13583:668-1363(+)